MLGSPVLPSQRNVVPRDGVVPIEERANKQGLTGNDDVCFGLDRINRSRVQIGEMKN